MIRCSIWTVLYSRKRKIIKMSWWKNTRKSWLILHSDEQRSTEQKVKLQARENRRKIKRKWELKKLFLLILGQKNLSLSSASKVKPQGNARENINQNQRQLVSRQQIKTVTRPEVTKAETSLLVMMLLLLVSPNQVKSKGLPKLQSKSSQKTLLPRARRCHIWRPWNAGRRQQDRRRQKNLSRKHFRLFW